MEALIRHPTGVIQYPMGHDEKTPVYYRLVSTTAPAGTTGGIQVGAGG